MEFFTRFKNEFVLIFVLLAQTIALAVQVRRVPDAADPDPHQVRLLRLWATSIVTPTARSIHFVSSGVRGGWSNYVALWHTRQQNEALRQQIAGIRLQQAAEAEDVIQGRRLQALLDFREHYISATVAAQVIGTSGSDQSRLVLLDKGADAGLKPDMPVITPDGIVGKLRDVFPHTSQLLLISDQSAGAGVMLESTRIRAILRGTPSGRVQIGNLTADSRIKPGERVLTSGGDQVFPRGLPVGVVESIAPDSEHQPYTAITIAPSAKLNQLEEVLVITGTQPDLPPQAQQDLRAAQAQHEADLAAGKASTPERGLDLSGNKPTDVSAQTGAAPATGLSPVPAAAPPPENSPGGLVPKPIPTLHPDRYSPGATAPAADLTPGAARGVAAGVASAAPTVAASTAARRPPRAKAPAEAAPADGAEAPR